jgi:hypothetical protein
MLGHWTTCSWLWVRFRGSQCRLVANRKGSAACVGTCRWRDVDSNADLSSAAGKKGRVNPLPCLFTYLAGLPHHGSPLVLPTHPQPPRCPEILQNRHGVAYIPRWRGEARWQSKSANATARGARKRKLAYNMFRNQNLPFKESSRAR